MRNSLSHRRRRLNWSQQELARRSGLSRAAISAIETGRVIPSTAAALALARAFDCSVEDLFSLGDVDSQHVDWAWEPRRQRGRFWRARVGGRTLAFPTEWTLAGSLRHDGVYGEHKLELTRTMNPEKTLVVAGCDPSVGLLSSHVGADCGLRVLPLIRSSREAIRLLGRGLVHAAGLHFDPAENLRAAREVLAENFRLVRVARWEAGVALDPAQKAASVREVLASNLRWVGREEGSAARQCLDQILGSGTKPTGYHHTARDHHGVSETIRTGWAQAGICVRLPAQERGLRFLKVREESYDLCYRADLESTLPIRSLMEVLRSRSYRNDLQQLPGFEAAGAGERI